MTQPAIRVEGLSKEYVIGGSESFGLTFRESVMEAVKAPLRRLAGRGSDVANEERFWALKDVSFEVQPGEVVGIIGRNGAGKSTLLKILSRITAPTKGRIEIRGRVASLLEVGTGFHPELTGRENIRLNGAILGMSGAEIARKFDEIVAFAGVERFIDTPVKRYSSGMQVRLAFAVAAHLDPEILIVDEVLAVGDAEFQKKCLGKMGEIAGKGGRTVLFVSHNLSAVSVLCESAIYLERGALVRRGAVTEILKAYTLSDLSGGEVERDPPTHAEFFITRAAAAYGSYSAKGEPALRLDLTILARKASKMSLDIRIKDGLGAPVGFGSLGALDSNEILAFDAGTHAVTIVVPTPRLAAGNYIVSIDLTIPTVLYFDRLEDRLSFSVEPIGAEVGMQPMKQDWGYGSVFFPIHQSNTGGSADANP